MTFQPSRTSRLNANKFAFKNVNTCLPAAEEISSVILRFLQVHYIYMLTLVELQQKIWCING